MSYSFKKIEAKWQSYWSTECSFATDDNITKDKYYILEMFPYPSGHFHMGHVRNYTLGDVCARFKRSQGYNVLHPMGWDAFGLPAENAARENNIHPKIWTYANIDAMRNDFKSLGLSYDWTREFATCDPAYYKYEQQFIIDFFNAGLLYRKESSVNWDPVENTVLANEQVINGRGWRSNALVEQRKMPQWYLRITDFAQELLDGLETLKDTWPEKVLTMQRNWIGRSDGAEINFDVMDCNCKIKIFTTRPDTIYGCTFIALSIHHPFVSQFCLNSKEVQQFVHQCSQLSTAQADLDKAEKIGIFTGFYVLHPLDPTCQIPVYLANFVLNDYGTGAIMGVPAHDIRDHEFAMKYDISIKFVIDFETAQNNIVYDGEEGHLINSPLIDGLTVSQAKQKIINYLESRGIGQKITRYRLKDWGISRQRFWGCPIPFIHCETCGIVPEKNENLPIELPDDINFDQPGNPLDHHPSWKHTFCPQCKRSALRETDTLDTFFESSWYFMRYVSQSNDQPFNQPITDSWLGVDKYIGGIEHAVMHLLYARFFTRALNKCGYTTHLEPFKSLITQGMVCHQTFQDSAGNWLYPEEVIYKGGTPFIDKTGEPVTMGRSIKMSKSKRNIVTPQSIREAYGVDTARLFVVSDNPPERDFEWSESGVQGISRFINRLWRLVDTLIPHLAIQCNQSSFNHLELDLKRKIHQTIDSVTCDFENFSYNTAIAKLRILFNILENISPLASYQPRLIRKTIEIIVQLLSPIIPHVCEELWEKLGHSTSLTKVHWPIAEPQYLVDSQVTIAIQVNGKLRATLDVNPEIKQEEIQALAFDCENIKRALADSIVHKVIYIPGKVINIVIN